jgi:hypothetical protein
VECRDDVFIVWPDGGLGESKTDDLQAIRFSRDDLSAALAMVQRDLGEFLDRLRDWTRRAAPELGDQLVRRFADTFVEVRSRNRPTRS